MLLRLKYSDTARHPLRGALIRGGDPVAWLEEISRWGVSAAELECYVLPESIHSLKAGGLFVCFSKNIPPLELLLQPYGRVGERLYLPLRTELHPDMHAWELENAFLWERQVFHPVIGLVGFGQNDRLNLAGLLDLPSAKDRKWGAALPGIAPSPKLEAIGLDRSPVEDFMQEMEEIGSTPPEEIPGGEEGQSAGQKLARDFQKGALKGVLGFMDALNKAFSGGGDVDESSGKRSGGKVFSAEDYERYKNSGGMGGPGVFERMRNWVSQRLEDLEEKRKAELDRLMDLFEKDPDAALKYAIPLGGNYWNRGTAPPSTKLGARSTDFKLGGLGGGKPVDGWRVDGYEAKLRQRYLDAANREIEAGNFRKAAYIHAHLLHDFTTAANVLEQGHFYREAAALYKDHLKNPSSAAECLERGGLLLDAIELYVEMGKREKAADLCITLKQKDKADILYQACADDALSKSDFREAGRLYQHKMDRPEKAMESYLDGWRGQSQAEDCLGRYLALFVDHGNTELHIRLERIYREETNPAQVDAFFRVLLRQRSGQGEPEARDAMDDLAMEIISDQASGGNFQSLNSIREIVPGDQLINTDSRRYIQRFNSQPADAKKRTGLRLDQKVRWIHAMGLRDSILALGIGEQGEICLARADWSGYSELHRLPGTIGHEGDRLMADAAVPGLVFILPQVIQKVPARKLLPGLKFKQELKVTSPPGYSADTMAVGMAPDGGSVVLDSVDTRCAFHFYDAEGKLLKSQLPVWENQNPFLFAYPVTDRRIRFFEGKMYLVSGSFLLVGDLDRSSFSGVCLGEPRTWVGKPALDLFFPGLESEAPSIMSSEANDDCPRTWAFSPYVKPIEIALGTPGGVKLIHNVDLTKDFLESEALVDDGFQSDFVEFLPGDFLAIAGPGDVQVYDLKKEAGAKLLNHFKVDDPVIGLMASDKRGEIAVVLGTGEVRFFEFDRQV